MKRTVVAMAFVALCGWVAAGCAECSEECENQCAAVDCSCEAEPGGECKCADCGEAALVPAESS